MNFRSFGHILKINKSFLTYLKSQKHILRHCDVSRVNWAPQVKPDVWGPHVSDTGANPGQTQR